VYRLDVVSSAILISDWYYLFDHFYRHFSLNARVKVQMVKINKQMIKLKKMGGSKVATNFFTFFSK